jgi:hypothetical protein
LVFVGKEEHGEIFAWFRGHLRALARSSHRWRKKKNTALSELGSEEDRLRRQRAHVVARILESLHLEGSDVDSERMAIAQGYVDGEILTDELTAAIEARSTDVS